MKQQKIKYSPVRMCINCRNRFAQKDLLRLQCEKKFNLKFYSNQGRSFYLCSECINSYYKETETNKNAQNQQLFKSIMRVCKVSKKSLSKDEFHELSLKIKEITFNVANDRHKQRTEYQYQNISE